MIILLLPPPSLLAIKIWQKSLWPLSLCMAVRQTSVESLRLTTYGAESSPHELLYSSFWSYNFYTWLKVK